MDEGCTYTDRIGPDADGETVARFYAARYRHSSEADWRARAEAGLVLRNGLPAGPDDRLRAGDVLRWNRPPWREPDVPRDVRVVLADDDIVVVDKPAGLPTIPGGGFVRNTLAAILRERFPGEAPVPVHRLGRGTSGLVLCARRPSARDALARQFREVGGEERALRKRYLARTAPVADPPAGDLEIAVPIGRVPHAPSGPPRPAAGSPRSRSAACSRTAPTPRSGKPSRGPAARTRSASTSPPSATRCWATRSSSRAAARAPTSSPARPATSSAPGRSPSATPPRAASSSAASRRRPVW